jgi:hypothetical protein
VKLLPMFPASETGAMAEALLDGPYSPQNFGNSSVVRVERSFCRRVRRVPSSRGGAGVRFAGPDSSDDHRLGVCLRDSEGSARHRVVWSANLAVRAVDGFVAPRLLSPVCTSLVTHVSLCLTQYRRRRYQFEYAMDFPGPAPPGDYHASEVIFVFDNQFPADTHVFSPRDQQMAAAFGTYVRGLALLLHACRGCGGLTHLLLLGIAWPVCARSGRIWHVSERECGVPIVCCARRQ